MQILFQFISLLPFQGLNADVMELIKLYHPMGRRHLFGAFPISPLLIIKRMIMFLPCSGFLHPPIGIGGQRMQVNWCFIYLFLIYYQVQVSKELVSRGSLSLSTFLKAFLFCQTIFSLEACINFMHPVYRVTKSLSISMRFWGFLSRAFENSRSPLPQLFLYVLPWVL